MASTLLSPMVDYYNDEEELDSVDDDDDRSFRGRDSEEGNVKRIDQESSLTVGLCLLVGEETETRDYCTNLARFFNTALGALCDSGPGGNRFLPQRNVNYFGASESGFKYQVTKAGGGGVGASPTRASAAHT